MSQALETDGRADGVVQQETGTEDAREQRRSASIGRSVGRAAHMMQSGELSTGDLAELRRISPDAPFTPALWKVLMKLDLADAPPGIDQRVWERRWATLLMGLAFCADLHDYKTPLGRALAEAGWSELRFVRLMRATDEQLETHVRRLAQFLASKAQKANWADVAWLLFCQSGDPSKDLCRSSEKAEEIRLGISRFYYAALYAKEKQ